MTDDSTLCVFNLVSLFEGSLKHHFLIPFWKETKKLRAEIADRRGPTTLIDRGPYAETLIKKGLLAVSDPELECTRCADDKVLEHYWKDLYKYTENPTD